MSNADFQTLITIAGPAIGAIVTGLLATLTWFIRRLIKKMDDIALAIPSIDTLAKDLASVKDEMKSMRADFHEMSDLKADVAVLKFAMEQDAAKTRGPGGLKQ